MKAETQSWGETTDRLNFLSPLMFSVSRKEPASLIWILAYLELGKQQRILEYPLDGLDEVRLESCGVLLLGVT